MCSQSFITIKKRADYLTVSKNCKSHKTKLFFFKIASKSILKQDHTAPVVGITITKKVGKAVSRNKIKRRIKAIFNELDFSTEESNYIYSFYARNHIMQANYSELKKDVNKIIKNLNEHIT